jgi:AAA+ superfamily predicted ATPase
MLGYVEIRFGHSTSASYPKALRAAQQFSGFHEASQDEPYSSVRVEASQLSAEYKHLRRLWDAISGWKSAEFLIDGRPGEFHDLYTLVRYVECAERRDVSPQPSRYCEKSHAGGQGWGCRYLSAIEREPAMPRYGFGVPPTGWWHFGNFDSDQHFVVHKEHILEALRKEAELAGLSFCPKYDFQRVSASVDSLPNEIDPSSSSTWEIVYEDNSEGATISRRAVGVRPPVAERPVVERRLTPQPDAVDRHVPDVTFDDVGGIDDIVQTIREVIELPMRQPRLFVHMGIQPHRGVLLYGPPGCGKTLIAKAIAGEIGANFIAISANELMGRYVGQSEERLRAVFDAASQFQPSIIFFDEIDAIGQSRTGGESVRHQDDFLNQLLSLMDGITDRGRVTVIGSTNRPELLDDALLRPGRFDYTIEVTKPTIEGCAKILDIVTKDSPLDDDVDLSVLAKELHGLSGADIAFVAREAAYNCLRRSLDLQSLVRADAAEPSLDKLKINSSDFGEAIRTALRSDSSSG